MIYIANFDLPKYAAEKRSINLAAANVMEYMAEVFSVCEPVTIVSPSRTVGKTGRWPSRVCHMQNGNTLMLPSTFGTSSKIGRLFSILWTQLWLLCFFLFKCRKGETIIVYHSAALMRIVKLAKRIKLFNLVMEIREVYSDVQPHVRKEKELEYFRIADKYIFATELLNKLINKDNKPYVVAPGIYKDCRIDKVEKFDDGKIHLVYAGNFNRAKGGAIGAISITEYLPANYVLHILGSGDPTTMDDVQKIIADQNSKSKAKVQYDGIKRGRDFNEFLQKCDIGLSTQNSQGAFNDSSFPSKILTYLSNGLEVVSADIAAVKTSPIGKNIHYYCDENPVSIVQTILNANDKKNSPNLLVDLNCDLINQFKKQIID